jgi:ferrous iron transport protein B
MNSEINNRKWFWAGIGLQLAVGYTLGFLVFFFGTLFVGGGFGSIWMPIVGWLILAVIAIILLCLIIKTQKNLKGEAVKGNL